MRAGDAERQAHAGAGIAEIDGALGLEQPARPQPVHAPAPVAAPLDGGAEGAHGGGGRHDVVGFEQAGDAGLADRQRAEHQRAVRNRLVAGHGDAAAQRAGGDAHSVPWRRHAS